MSNGIFGVYRGVVYNTADPLNQNRIQMQVPQVLGVTASTGTSSITAWAPPLGYVDTAPKIGEQVVCIFIGGDLTQPAYLAYTDSATDIAAITSPGDMVVGDVSGKSSTLPAGPAATVLTSAGPDEVPAWQALTTTEGDLVVGGPGGTPERLGAGSAGSLLTSGGTSALPAWLAAGTSGYVLTSNGASSTPTWTSLASITSAISTLQSQMTTAQGNISALQSKTSGVDASHLTALQSLSTAIIENVAYNYNENGTYPIALMGNLSTLSGSATLSQVISSFNDLLSKLVNENYMDD